MTHTTPYPALSDDRTLVVTYGQWISETLKDCKDGKASCSETEVDDESKNHHHC